MIHSNKIRDADVHFVIDPITRTIKSASATKTSVIQYDHNSERFTFMLPRYIEGHDMMESTNVEVHYINANAATSGVYIVEDLRTDDTEENVLCSWLLSQNVTQNAGMLHFLLRFSCIADDGTIEYAWNTAIHKGISVASGMNNSGKIIEQHADVLAKWEKDLFSSIEKVNADIYRIDKNEFELIASGETTEEVNSIVVTADNDGNPFELCDMITIYAQCPKASANSSLAINFENAIVHQTAATAINTNYIQYIIVHGIYTGKCWSGYSVANAGGVSGVQGEPKKQFCTKKTVNEIKMYLYDSDLALPVGFKYEIYGRRVKHANS